MKLIRNLLLATTVSLAGVAAASAASATTLLVNDVGVASWDYKANGHTSTAILFNDTLTTDPLVVFCVDLYNGIGVTHYDPALVYEVRDLTVNGEGLAFRANAFENLKVSNKIGRLARLGRSIYFGGGDLTIRNQNLAAIQGAIWQLEYNTPFSSTDAPPNTYVNEQIAKYANIGYYNGGYAKAYYSVGRVGQPGARFQNQVGVVPEPASWALMIGGFGMAGAMLRRRRAITA